MANVGEATDGAGILAGSAGDDRIEGGGGLVRLEGVAADEFDASDFVFHEPAADAASVDGM